MLNHYAGRLAAAGADYEFLVDLPESLPLAEPDICVVLGNLLENALEACAGQDEPYIRVAARTTDGGAVTILVDNTAPVKPLMDADGGIRSTKHTGHGIGTQSIRYIARQYGGTASFQWENGMFLASVFLDVRTVQSSDTLA